MTVIDEFGSDPAIIKWNVTRGDTSKIKIEFLNNDEVTMLKSENKPQLQFNILESRISRLLGEMSKQEPDILVTADDEFENKYASILDLLFNYFMIL